MVGSGAVPHCHKPKATNGEEANNRRRKGIRSLVEQDGHVAPVGNDARIIVANEIAGLPQCGQVSFILSPQNKTRYSRRAVIFTHANTNTFFYTLVSHKSSI